MEITASNFCDVLNVENVVAEEDKVTLTAEQVQTIDTALNENKKTIEQLKAEIETLKQKPADTTTTVVDDKAKAGEKNEVEGYVDTLNSARELYNSL